MRPCPRGVGTHPAKQRAMHPRDGASRVALGVGLYVVVLGALALWRWHIGTYGADTGLFTQVVGDAFGGFRDGPEDGTHFRFHWAPVLGVLWPLVSLTHFA